MLSKHLETFYQVLVLLLIASVAVGYNPWPSSTALFFFLTYRLADKYFHDSCHDQNRATLAKLSTDLAKVKATQDRMDIKAAFGGAK